MTRKELEQYLGKTVKIKLFDDDVIVGELHKTGEEQFKNNPSLYFAWKYYVLLNQNSNSCLFRVSHVKKLEVIE